MGYKQVFVKGVEMLAEFDAAEPESACFIEGCQTDGSAGYVDLTRVWPIGCSKDILELLSDDAIELIKEQILND